MKQEIAEVIVPPWEATSMALKSVIFAVAASFEMTKDVIEKSRKGPDL